MGKNKIEKELLEKYEQQLNVYRQRGFNEAQIVQIAYGLFTNIDVSLYAMDLRYNAEQMKELRFAIVRGINIGSFLDHNIPAKEMKRRRRELVSALGYNF